MNHRRLLLSLFFVFGATLLANATPKTPGGGMGPSCWPPPCSVPIDGGVSLLLAAGAALGTKKILDARKKENS